MLNEIKSSAEQKMKKSIESLAAELAKLRTGRAHPSLLEKIMVEYYGQPSQLNQVATIVVEDSRTLSVTPFEKSMVTVCDKAIRTSGLGLNPATAGQVIRVPLPPLTEETRRNLTKQMRTEAENSKVSIRNARRDANNQLKALLKDKEIAEDEDRKTQDIIQKLTDKYISEVDSMATAKEADLMQV